MATNKNYQRYGNKRYGNKMIKVTRGMATSAAPPELTPTPMAAPINPSVAKPPAPALRFT